VENRAHLKQTYSGKAIDVLNLNPNDICIEDIAHALSLTNRYGGHTPIPYTVGMHSILCSGAIRNRDYALEALMHDAAEAYIGDMTRPIKMLDQANFFRELEDKIYNMVANKYGFSSPMSSEVNEIDKVMLYVEADLFFPVEDRPFDWQIDNWFDATKYDKDDILQGLLLIQGYNHTLIERVFIDQFIELTR
jgi:5'-deoxynucleotidase YfbR-like HD superfamily hydrolase